MELSDVDVVILGGGPAGLSAALILARARRRVVVVDAGDPRNASAEAAHGLLGNEGIAPGQLLAKGRDEIVSFGAEVRHGAARAVRADGRGFVVSLDDDVELRSRAVIIATGVRDELPPIEGLRERWGRDVIHCPYCHGYEVRDRRIGLVATNPMSALQALMFGQWSDDVRFFTQGMTFSDGDLAKLAAVGIPVVDDLVTEALIEGDALSGVLVGAGRRIDLDVLAVPTRTVARLDGLDGLELETTDTGMGFALVADAAGHTSRAGVWAAGNVANGTQQIGDAAANGARVAMNLNTEFVFEDAETAVASATTVGARS